MGFSLGYFSSWKGSHEIAAAAATAATARRSLPAVLFLAAAAAADHVAADFDFESTSNRHRLRGARDRRTRSVQWSSVTFNPPFGDFQLQNGFRIRFFRCCCCFCRYGCCCCYCCCCYCCWSRDCWLRKRYFQPRCVYFLAVLVLVLFLVFLLVLVLMLVFMLLLLITLLVFTLVLFLFLLLLLVTLAAAVHRLFDHIHHVAALDLDASRFFCAQRLVKA